ncbi:hypothetical protein [Pseudoalteromonas galatheae]|uniref:hypothetical protein n=1 Tax=Pseudoalteromonas galatheae TaxID=579562 RepID=UPI0030D5523B
MMRKQNKLEECYSLRGICVFILISTFLIVFSSLLIEAPLISKDKSGKYVNCNELKLATESGHTDFVSYYLPMAFEFGPKTETVFHYEQKTGYSFKSCRAEIDTERDEWCKKELSAINEENVTHASSFIKKHCGFVQNDWVKSFDSQRFDTKKSMIKAGSKWIRVEKIELWEPREAFNGLFELCFSYDYVAHCKYTKDEKDAYLEFNRLINIMSK